MALSVVPLAFGGSRSGAALRELRGEDEQCVSAVDTAQAIALIDRLCVAHGNGYLAAGEAADLVAHDRDRVLAAIYAHAYGDRIDGLHRCARCGEQFDFAFRLSALVQSAAAMPQTSAPRDMRLPTGHDELAVAALPRALARTALLERMRGTGSLDDAEVERALEDAAPILALELGAICPECGAEQTVSFDVQFALLGSLAAERQNLALEIHQLARAYGWGLADILDLSRAQRRAFVALVRDEPPRARR
jgi:hypothetical protein